MYGLYGWLLAKGQIAFLNAQIDAPFVGIYPEIYYGNDMGAPTVVRYILNKPGVMAKYGIPGPKEFDSNDRIYVFSRIYDTFNSPEEKILFLPILNLNLFRDQKKARRGACLFIGKGQNLDTYETLGLSRLTKEIALDQGKLADFLNQFEVMYSFENPTAMNEIARLCGCRVIFIPERANLVYTQEELATKYEPGMTGVAWGGDNDTPFDVEAFRSHYMSLRRLFSKRLDRFIEDTQRD